MRVGAEMGTAKSGEVDKGATPGTSIAHKPKPGSLKYFWMPSTIALFFGATEGAPEEFHNARAGIHRRRRHPILVTPFTHPCADRRSLNSQTKNRGILN